jgi:hypothetical protein
VGVTVKVAVAVGVTAGGAVWVGRGVAVQPSLFRWAWSSQGFRVGVAVRIIVAVGVEVGVTVAVGVEVGVTVALSVVQVPAWTLKCPVARPLQA